jgi:hypothetical protein
LAHVDGPDWLGKSLAIVVGALVTLAGGSRFME